MQNVNKGNTNLPNVKREQTDIDPLDVYWVPPPPPQPSMQPISFSHLADESFITNTRVLSPTEQQDLEIQNFIKNAKVKPIKFEDVPASYEGLQQFTKFYAWQNIVKLSKILLFDENTTEELLKSITNIRFEGLFRMKLYDELIAEVQGILNRYEQVTVIENNDFNIDYHTTMSMRLLLTNIKLMTGRGQEAMDQLLILKRWLLCCNDHESSTIILYWLWEVKSNIINAYIRLRNWKAATLELNNMINEIEILINDSKSIQEKSNYVKALIYVMIKLSRLLLQIGSIQKASFCYEKASELYANDQLVSKDSTLLSQLLITQGLVLFSLDQFEQALDIFTTIIDTETSQSYNTNKESIDASSFFDNPPVLSSFNHNIDTNSNCTYQDNEEMTNNVNVLITKSIAIMTSISMQSKSYVNNDSNLLDIAVNNFAICSLYMKRIREAIKHLEQLILSNPSKYLIDPIVFNLCTLYDLSFAPETSTNKKKILQRIASSYQVDDPILHWKSFRLS